MDVKSAFNNVSKPHLGKRIEALGIEADLIRWAMSFMSDRQVKIAQDGEVGKALPVDTGVPQGSPAAPILFVTYLSGIFDEVERYQASVVYPLWMTSGGGQRARTKKRWQPS